MSEWSNRAFYSAMRERESAHIRHGDKSMESTPWNDPTGRRLRILLEEVGEIAREFNDAELEGRPVHPAQLLAELVQVCAMAGAWGSVIPDE